MNSELVKKLRLPTDSDRVLVLDAPAGYMEQLGLGSKHTALDEHQAGSYEFVQMFFRSIRDVEAGAAQALQAVIEKLKLGLKRPSDKA
ncbi:MAG: hypothetical protein E7E23_21355 [Paenibacillus sp.]|uniref:hypothetical protein n=1 Tax=Paenibacillus sp. TaxID=58172 RepID=UPI00290407AF|nr:hypothetical protein [Paenibacillus sp.]MDU2243118.1 hypothetical protein [Paenibacillus sp.]